MDTIRSVVTVKTVLESRYRKNDGTNFVRLRVTYKRKIKYLKTQILVTDSDIREVIDRKTGKPTLIVRTGAIQDKMDRLEKKMRDMLLRISC